MVAIEILEKNYWMNMIDFTNYPFKNMPITNGCFLTAIIPALFMFVSNDGILFGIWFIAFCWSIILDKKLYDI